MTSDERDRMAPKGTRSPSHRLMGHPIPPSNGAHHPTRRQMHQPQLQLLETEPAHPATLDEKLKVSVRSCVMYFICLLKTGYPYQAIYICVTVD